MNTHPSEPSVPFRFWLKLEFDGAPFCGWQVQHQSREGQSGHAESIQGTLERAIATLFHKKSGERLVVHGCGRTDAGVHAREYFCHVDVLDSELSTAFPREDSIARLEKFRHALNCMLPAQLSVLEARVVPSSLHAQKSVTAKTYEYRILLRRAKPTLDAGALWWIPIDAHSSKFSRERLDRALAHLEGKHDFRAFLAAHSSVKSTVRTIHSATAEWRALNEASANGGEESCKLLILRFKGDGFLKHQVRNMVGTVIDIAQGKYPSEQIQKLLGEGRFDAPQDRTKAGYCAPPEGLYLVSVEYGDYERDPEESHFDE